MTPSDPSPAPPADPAGGPPVSAAAGGLRRHAPLFGFLAVMGLTIAGLALTLQLDLADQRRRLFVLEPLLVGAVVLAVFVTILYGAVRGALRWRWALPLLLLAWLGTERYAPPYLVRSLRLKTWLALQDPDHRPEHTARAQGWNSDSLRCPRESSAYTEASTNVLICGDSFTFGLGLGPQQCFPQLVENRLRQRLPERDVLVANFGWNSSSPLLAWRRLLDVGDAYSPDLVVYCLDMTDIRDDIRYTSQLERKGMYGVVEHLPLLSRAFEALAPELFEATLFRLNPELPERRFFLTDAPLEQTRPLFATTVEMLGRLEAWSRERGADFVLIVLPRPYQYSARECPHNKEAAEYEVLGEYCLEPFRFFEELAGEVDYPIHSLLEAFRTTDVFPTAFDDDPHWNPDGAAVAARAIAELLEARLSER